MSLGCIAFCSRDATSRYPSTLESAFATETNVFELFFIFSTYAPNWLMQRAFPLVCAGMPLRSLTKRPDRVRIIDDA